MKRLEGEKAESGSSRQMRILTSLWYVEDDCLEWKRLSFRENFLFQMECDELLIIVADCCSKRSHPYLLINVVKESQLVYDWLGFWQQCLLEDLRTLGTISIINFKTNGFSWILLSKQMVPTQLCCCFYFLCHCQV